MLTAVSTVFISEAAFPFIRREPVAPNNEPAFDSAHVPSCAITGSDGKVLLSTA